LFRFFYNNFIKKLF